MNVLIACEESQTITIEMRKLGHQAFSCVSALSILEMQEVINEQSTKTM